MMSAQRMIRGFAKEGQDLWVLEKLKGKTGGYFVDLGAHDGLHSSNSLLLEEQLGWSGICVEPHPASFEPLRRHRRCICENLCVYSENGTANFVPRQNHQLSGIVNADSSPALRNVVERDALPAISVPAITLVDLLIKHDAPPVIDYLSIDTEGAEYPILSRCDFSRYKFLTITVEHNAIVGRRADPWCLANQARIRALLTTHGYVFEKSVVADDWYVHQDLVTC